MHRCQAMDGEGFACNRRAYGRFQYHGDDEMTSWIGWVWVHLCERCAQKEGYNLKSKDEYPTTKANPHARARLQALIKNRDYRQDYPIFGGLKDVKPPR